MTHVYVSIAANLLFFCATAFCAVRIVPFIEVSRLWAKISASAFFLLLGLHSLDDAAHQLFRSETQLGDLLSWSHVLALDVPVMLALWGTVLGLYLEISDRGYWKPRLDLKVEDTDA